MKKQRQIFSAVRWEKVRVFFCLFHRLSTWPHNNKVKLAPLLNSKEKKKKMIENSDTPFGRLVVVIF